MCAFPWFDVPFDVPFGVPFDVPFDVPIGFGRSSVQGHMWASGMFPREVCDLISASV